MSLAVPGAVCIVHPLSERKLSQESPAQPVIMFEDRVSKLVAADSPDLLWGGLKGVEKESLRVGPDGHLAETPHPRLLGSALTNQFITTDFSEALLEFVTPPRAETWETLRFLCELHQFSYERMGDELLWATSMPCRIPTELKIPLARYGSSNVGRMKTIYRRGLGHRYGRNMQTIAGVHFNYSLPEAFWPVFREQELSTADMDSFRSDAYLGLVRNFRRFGWLVLYLFGASPALCKSFVIDPESAMPTFDGETYFEPFGTSLRMSDLGYSNNTQANISISLNNLDDYISDLSRAMRTPEPAFENIGVKVDGEYRQLSVNQLQIENEYYSAIRPKRVSRSGERPTAALRRGGIEYVEIRSLDINVFDPVGINQNAMRFMEAFLIYCVLQESPPLGGQDWEDIAWNQAQTAKQGRNPELELKRNGNMIPLRDWAADIVRDVGVVAELIDRGNGQADYAGAVEAQSELVRNPDATPSARLLEELRSSGASFFAFALAAANGHKEYFAALEPLPDNRLKSFEREAADSIDRQEKIEAADEISFDGYLEHYFAGDRARYSGETNEV